MLELAAAGVGFEHALDFGTVHAGLDQFGPDQVGLFADELDIEHSESVPEQFEFSAAAVAGDRYHIEADGLAARAMTIDEYLSRAADAMLLALVHRGLGSAGYQAA